MGIQIPFMVFVGLMGGAAYVNIAYSILSSEVIPKEMKELCLNINAICSNIGITIATLITIIVDNIWTWGTISICLLVTKNFRIRNIKNNK